MFQDPIKQNLSVDLIAPCGMNCGICQGYLRDKNKCLGCREMKASKPNQCRKCTISHCDILKKNKMKFCSDKCKKYPCTRLKNLDKKKNIALKDILFIVIVSSVFCITYIKSYLHGIEQMKARDMHINGAAFCLEDPNNASDDDLKRLYPNPDIIRERIKTLADLGITFDREK